MNMITLLLILASSIAIAAGTSPTTSYLLNCHDFCAFSAVILPGVGPVDSVEKTAFYFDESQYPPSVYNTQDGKCTLTASINQNNSITITGTVYGSDNSTGFFLNIQANQVNLTEPFLELNASVYKANGGLIDPSLWTQFSITTGTLTGFGTYQGTTITLSESMHPLQMGYGANGKNMNFGLSAWFYYTLNGIIYMSDINVDLHCKDIVCPPSWNVTNAYWTDDSYAITLSETEGSTTVRTGYTFVDPTGLFTEDATLSSAVLSGYIRRTDGTPGQCTVAAIFRRNLTYNVPHKAFGDSDYAPIGPVDPTTWRYYSLVGSGTIDCPSSGEHTTFTTFMDMPLQLGIGANDKNWDFGFSGWFEYTLTTNGQLTESGILDLNTRLICGPLAPTPAPPTPAPTVAPTKAPTAAPTQAPTQAPTFAPTQAPTAAPTQAPTQAPTAAPTSAPTEAPTTAPTEAPTSAPTEAPTATPTEAPTDAPTSAPTEAPTAAPTEAPTSAPTDAPTSGVTSGTSGSYTTGDNSNSCPPAPYTAVQAIADQYGGYSYFAFIFNTSTNIQYRFDFSDNSGLFQIDTSAGTATLTGTLAPLSYNPQDGVFNFSFSVDLVFTQAGTPTQYIEELKPEAYVPNGPVDPSTWTFWQLSSTTITPSDAQYSLTITPFKDMALQVGAGANQKNVNFGAGGWFSFFLIDNYNSNNLVDTGVMDINVDLQCNAATTGGASATSGSQGSSGGQVTPPTTPSTPSSAATLPISAVFLLVALAFNL